MRSREPTSPRFSDREDAGRELARHLHHYRGRPDVVVLALPRGGVPVAHVVAAQLAAMLDIFVVRKIGMPGQREYAIGALASGGVLVLDRNIPRRYGVSDADVDAVVQEEQIELARRERAYRRGAPLPPLDGRIVILVDDGLATGATMRAAVQALRTSSPARIVVAVPVGACPSSEPSSFSWISDVAL